VKSIYIFFGIPGSGKSYLGKKFADKIGAYFYEADDDYTDEMREESKKSEEHKKMINDQLYSLVVDKTAKFKEEYGKVVVASALGSNHDRHKFIDRFGVDVAFVLVKPDSSKHLENTFQRELADPNREKISPEELKSKLEKHLEKKQLNFEEPDFAYEAIDNNFNDYQDVFSSLLSKYQESL